MLNMRIKNQNWEVNSKYLILYLNEPFWSAYQRFNWLEGTEGYSISEAALLKAKELKKKILVKNKYGDYEITTSKASRYLNCQFTARDGTLLICIPRSAFKKLPPLEEEHEIDLTISLTKLAETPGWEALGQKLHS